MLSITCHVAGVSPEANDRPRPSLPYFYHQAIEVHRQDFYGTIVYADVSPDPNLFEIHGLRRPGPPPWADADGCPHAGRRSRHMREANSGKLSCWHLYICLTCRPGIGGH